MAELSPELYQKVRDLKKFKELFTVDEIGRRVGVAAAIGGGMDPRQAREYHLGQSPYRLTQSEFDKQLAQLMELEERATRLERSSVKGDELIIKEAIEARQRVNEHQNTMEKARLEYRGQIDSKKVPSFLERIRLFEDGDPPKLGNSLSVKISAMPDDKALTDASDFIDELVARFDQVDEGGSAKNFLAEVAKLRDQSPNDLIAEIKKSSENDDNPQMLKFHRAIEHKLSFVPPSVNDARQELSKMRAGGASGSTPPVTEAAIRVARAEARDEAPEEEDVSLLMQTLAEFKESPPIRGERERLQSGGDFLAFMREFYERYPLSSTEKARLSRMEGALAEDPEALSEEASAEYQELKSRAEDQPFSDIEKKGALRGAQMLARRQAKGERQDVRQRMRGLRRGEDTLANEEFLDVPETRPRSAELNTPAPAASTSETGEAEEPGFDAYSATEFTFKSGVNAPYVFRLRKDPTGTGRWEAKKKGADTFSEYRGNPYAEEGLYDMLEEAKLTGNLEQTGDALTSAISKQLLYGADLFGDAPLPGDAPPANTDPETGFLAGEEDEQKIPTIQEVPPVHQPKTPSSWDPIPDPNSILKEAQEGAGITKQVYDPERGIALADVWDSPLKNPWGVTEDERASGKVGNPEELLNKAKKDGIFKKLFGKKA